MGLDVMILVFWMLSFKPTFSLSSFTFIKRLFSIINYNTLLIINYIYNNYITINLIIWILEWVAISFFRGSSWLRDQTLISFISGRFFTIWAIREALYLYISTYKLKSQSDNIQPWHTPFPIWNQSFVPCLVLTVVSCPLISQETGKVVWYSHLFKNFPVCCEPHIKVFSIVNEIEVDFFFLILLLFLWSSGCWHFDLWFLCLF